MQSNIVETITGAIVVVVAVVFFVFAYQAAGLGRASGGYEIGARFAGVSGLVTGADVRLSGIKVGSVVDQRLDTETYEAIVTMAIAPDVKLPKGSSAKITTDGLLGGAYVSLQPGPEVEMMAAGDEIDFTQGSVSLMDIVGRAIFGGEQPQ